ncbi:pyridoxamine 5'-phosphate oxidase family protein [Aeromicrobium sp. UC242_57]|uniref:pyridoxamine 5'-phosphate oxidase family protein n=1 Tax=Aeromicrobium sp. UC242_57 TaxID=3374624 RepID=UPI0037AE7A8B
MPTRPPARMPEKMSPDRALLDQLLDDKTVLAHVAFVDDDGNPAALPTLVARLDDSILVHGSTGSRWMRRIASGVDVAVSVAVVDGVVVARSAFESSLVYTSAVLFGSFTPVAEAEREPALNAMTERLIPGRVDEVRPSTKRELAATMILQMPIRQWSLRTSDNWPEDPADDVTGPAWAGQLRFGAPSVDVYPAPDLRDGIEPPPSISQVRGVR